MSERETDARTDGRSSAAGTLDDGSGAAAVDGARAGERSPTPGRRAGLDPLFGVRTADIEPYTGLRYLSKLFRLIAIVLIVLLLAEVVTGLIRQGIASIPTLVGEVSRLIVLAGLLWGIGDLAILLVDVGHDVRAVRILIGRQTSHLVHHASPPAPAAPPATPAGTGSTVP